MAVVTFGGAYAVLSYVAQQAAEHYAWVTPTQMLDGLGLAESTPGPLILVVQFVGFLAAYQATGMDHPLHALFSQLTAHTFVGPLHLDVPDASSVRWAMVLLTTLAFVMTFALKWSLARSLAVCATAGVMFTLWAWRPNRSRTDPRRRLRLGRARIQHAAAAKYIDAFK